MSVAYGTKLKNFCPVRDSLFLHDDKRSKNIKSLLKFYNYDLRQLLLITHTLLILETNSLRFVNIECILSKQYYLEKRSAFKCRFQIL